MNKSLNDLVLSLLKDDYSDTSIINRIIKEGLTEIEAFELYHTINKNYQKKKRKKLTFYWSISSLCLILFYLFLIPSNLTFHSPFLYSISLGLVLGLLLFQSFFCYTNFHDFIEMVTQKNNEKVPIEKRNHLIFLFIIPIVSIVLLYFGGTKKSEYEFKKYGITTTANVFDGYSYTRKSRRNTLVTSELIFKFKNNHNKYIEGRVSVSEEEFNQTYVGKEVKIQFSPRYNDMVKIIHD